jgi:chromosome segregation ATPase
MNTTDMINHIRANKQPLSQRVLQAIADRLEEQDAYLRSALGTLSIQEEQLRGLGSELAESERHRQILTTQNKELLDSRKALEATCAPVAAWWELAKKDPWAEFLGGMKDIDEILVVHEASESRYVTAGELDALERACAGVKHG